MLPDTDTDTAPPFELEAAYDSGPPSGWLNAAVSSSLAESPATMVWSGIAVADNGARLGGGAGSVGSGPDGPSPQARAVGCERKPTETATPTDQREFAVEPSNHDAEDISNTWHHSLVG